MTTNTTESSTDAGVETDPGAEQEVTAREPNDGAEEKLVPVSESIRYRRRAQQAEQKLNELQQMLEQTRGDLGEARRSLDEAERRRRIDALLVESDVIDLEAARLLTEATIEQMDDADVAEAIDDLRRHKPYLFRQRESGGAMSPRPRHGDAAGPADDAAAAALASGNRRDLLRYLRLRRGE